jgi:Cytochrome domain of cellobiose dehydrogenase/Domain of unknown function (DUF2427)
LSTAQLQTNCEGSVCYSVHVPQQAASSGSGDIYFQIKAPTSLTWAGFGQGTGMVGSNIFVIYADSSQKNVTLSARYATAHAEPQHDNVAKVSLLAGSGIEGGNMIANVLCQNCNQWTTGSMQFNDPESSWVWAWKQGDPVASDSTSAQIEQHDDMGIFTFDLTKAAGGADSTNPFVSSNGSSTIPSSSGGSSSSSSSSSSSDSMLPTMLTAHGTLMGLSMVLLFPIGAMLRAFGTSVWLHAGWQTVTYLIAISGMGCGIWIALYTELLTNAHPIIGLVVVSTLSLQPIGGLLQHRHYRKHGTRGVFGWAHRVLGTLLILLGMINGGLGLQLAANSTQAEIAYAVIAALMGAAWLAASVLGPRRRQRSEARKAEDSRAS